MGIFDGQSVNAAITNPAFLDANADDVALGKIGFQNTDPLSGSFITNIQRAINTLWTTTGATESTPGTAYGAPPSTITDATSHQTALTALANKFHPGTGHYHTGGAGDGPAIAASSIASVPLKGYFIQGTDLLASGGLSTIVTSELSGKSVSTGQTVPGVVTNAPYNKIILRQASGINTDDEIVDVDGNVVFGRLTWLAGVWTLSYYIQNGPVDVPYSVPSQDIRWYYQELYNPLSNPPVYSELASIPSDNTTSDVANATTSFYGKVVLSATAPAAIASVGVAGTGNGSVANADHTHEGVHSIGIFGDASTLLGDVKLEAGDNITLTYNLGRLRIKSNGAIGQQEPLSGTVNGVNTTFGPMSQTPSSEESILVFIDSLLIPDDMWTQSGLNIVFDALSIPQVGQSVYVFYLTQGVPVIPPIPTGTNNVEYHTVTVGEEAAKQFTLVNTPAESTKVLCDIIGAGAQAYPSDFTISANLFQWNGLGLDGLLASGDVVRLQYYS